MSEAIKYLLSQVDIRSIISEDFELRDYGHYSKGIEHDSLVVDHEKNIFYWNSLEISGNALDWLTRVKGLPIKDAIDKLHKHVGKENFDSSFELPVERNIYPKLLDIFFELGKNHREFWYSRGYNDKVIDQFKLGFTGKCYVTPIIFENQLYNFQCRTPDKRIWSWATGLGVLPFNFDVLKDATSVLITESPADTVIATQYGFKAVSQSGGSGNWNKFWNQFFTNIKEIVFAYDNDSAGFLGSCRTARMFEDRAKILVWPDEYPLKFDCGDLLKSGKDKELIRLLFTETYPLKVIETFKNSKLQYYRKLENEH